MKKTLLTGLLTAGAALGALAQGQVNFDNSASSSGLIYVTSGGTTAPEQSTTLYGTLTGGAAASGLVVLAQAGGSATSADVLQDNIGPGVYLDDTGNSYIVPGVASGGTAFFQTQYWEGNYSSYSAAQTAGAAVGQSSVFSQTIGGGTATPPSLTGMPAVTLSTTSIPEPGTFALAGLGAADRKSVV